jgi:putative methyltransferase (TIGR04325 family)
MRNELKFPLNHPNQIINNKIYDNFLFHNIVINKKLIKQFIYKFKNIIANVFYKLFYKIHLYNKKNEIVKWEGKYENWQDAMKYSNSYSNIQILEKCKTSLLRVKNGDAVYERDSIIFNEIQYSWPVTAILIKVGFENNSNLCILDYGGSLGSSFFQNKNFLSNISNLNWCIIEQEHFVECGIENFQNDNLSFYYDLDSFFDKNIPNIVLFSSVLQYLEKPYELLTKIIEEKVKYIIFDLTTFIDSNEDVITIQTVKPPIYDATYPCWFFNKEQLITFFLINGYSVEYQWMANYQINFGYHAGLAFKLNN